MVQMEITETNKNSPRMVVIPKALSAIKKKMGDVKVEADTANAAADGEPMFSVSTYMLRFVGRA